MAAIPMSEAGNGARAHLGKGKGARACIETGKGARAHTGTGNGTRAYLERRTSGLSDRTSSSWNVNVQGSSGSTCKAVFGHMQ